MSIARLLSLVVVTVLLFVSVPIGAQQPVAPPPPQIPYGAPINLEQAKKVLVGAEAEAKKNKWNMVIAVLDSGGHLVMLERMDGTQLGRSKRPRTRRTRLSSTGGPPRCSRTSSDRVAPTSGC